jgi:hypothetical protein
MDVGFVQAVACDGNEFVDQYGALMRPSDRRKDVPTIDRPSQPKVLLLQLTQCTSGKGAAYLTVGPGEAELTVHGKELP